MAKKILAKVKLNIQAGQANPSPPIGPALGQHGVNIMEFCKAYNARTKEKAGTVIPVLITIYADRSFSFVTRTPPASVLLREEAKVPKGSGEPNRNKVGRVSMAQVRKIAEQKMTDLNTKDIDSAMKMIVGTARSMGIEIES